MFARPPGHDAAGRSAMHDPDIFHKFSHNKTGCDISRGVIFESLPYFTTIIDIAFSCPIASIYAYESEKSPPGHQKGWRSGNCISRHSTLCSRENSLLR